MTHHLPDLHRAPMVRLLPILVAMAPLTAQDEPPSHAPFIDVTESLALSPANSAAAWVDVDGDGWIDLCCGSVWRNEQGQAFRKLSEPGVGVFADFDRDGDADVFVYSQHRVLLNDGSGAFSPLEQDPEWSGSCRGAAWADFDEDGFLDLYVGGYEDWDKGLTYPDRILGNVEGLRLELRHEDPRFRARGVSACDFDEDADLDVYVSNYRLQPNLLLRNDGKGSLVDIASSHGAVATDEGFGGGHSIGAAWGDFDGDAHFDLFAGNFAHRDSRGNQPQSRFLRNRGPEHDHQFEDRGTGGVHYQESYASPAAADVDLDGDLDLYFTTVYATASFGHANHSILFDNRGEWSFEDISKAAGLADLPPTYQAAWGDYDQDGDLDLVSAGRLFQNQAAQADGAPHWLQVRLKSPAGLAPSVGVQVRVRAGERRFVRQEEAGTGEGNQNSAVLHFGLGDHATSVDLEIRWSKQQRQLLRDIEVDQVIDVVRPAENP